MKGYTAIEGPLTGEVPLAAYTLYNEFKPGDIAHFQKFFDLFTEKGIFDVAADGRLDALQGLTHEPTPTSAAAARRHAGRRADARCAALRRARDGAGCCRCHRPAACCSSIWDLVVRIRLIKPILLPPPAATLRDAGQRPGRRRRCCWTSCHGHGARCRPS